MAIKRKLTINSITQTVAGVAVDLTNNVNFATHTDPISVVLDYTSDSNERTNLRFTVHLAHKDPAHTQSNKRHRKGDILVDRRVRVTIAGGSVPVTLPAINFPGARLADFPQAVFVIHVRERDGLASVSRNIARDA